MEEELSKNPKEKKTVSYGEGVPGRPGKTKQSAIGTI